VPSSVFLTTRFSCLSTNVPTPPSAPGFEDAISFSFFFLVVFSFFSRTGAPPPPPLFLSSPFVLFLLVSSDQPFLPPVSYRMWSIFPFPFSSSAGHSSVSLAVSTPSSGILRQSLFIRIRVKRIWAPPHGPGNLFSFPPWQFPVFFLDGNPLLHALPTLFPVSMLSFFPYPGLQYFEHCFWLEDGALFVTRSVPLKGIPSKPTTLFTPLQLGDGLELPPRREVAPLTTGSLHFFSLSSYYFFAREDASSLYRMISAGLFPLPHMDGDFRLSDNELLSPFDPSLFFPTFPFLSPAPELR